MIRTSHRETSDTPLPLTGRTVFTISSLPEARKALSAARSAGTEAVLLSPPDAAAFMGAPWWTTLIRLLKKETSQPFLDILDCGTQAGHATTALSLGQTCLILSPDCPQYPQICTLAASLSARVLPRRPG